MSEWRTSRSWARTARVAWRPFTPRRWLLLANPALAKTITEAIGDDWIEDLGQLTKLKPLAEDPGFRDAYRATKRASKSAFAQWLRSSSGQTVDPDSIF